jgi:hypothetical protein
MTLPLAGDLVVAVLLVITIAFAAILNRRLAVLRSDKAQLQALIQSLSTASHGAESAVAALKSTNDEAGRQLETRLGRAQGLCDDLAYMIERGNTLADRLEGAIRARRDAPVPAPAPEPVAQKPAARADGAVAERRSSLSFAPRVERDVDDRRAPPSLPSRTERDLRRALSGRR